MAFLSGFDYRKKLTIDNTKVDASLSNFPVYVKLTDSNFDFSKAYENGEDIRFTSDNETTLLDYERCAFYSDPVYGSDFCTGGSASGCSHLGSPGNAFDDNKSTYSATGPSVPFPHWIAYDLGSGVTKTARKLRLKVFSNVWGAYCKDFTLWGSNLASPDGDDDNDWTLIYTGQTANNDAWQDFEFSNSTAYRHFRVKVTSNWRSAQGYTDMAFYEIEMMEATSETHYAYFWVKVPTVDNSTDTDFYIYYGGASGTADGENATGVWDSTYEMVQHMTDDPDNSNIADSTSNSYDGTKTSADNPLETSGSIYKAQDFSSDGINLGSTLAVSGDGMIEGFINPDSLANNSILVRSDPSSGEAQYTDISLLIWGGKLACWIGGAGGASDYQYFNTNLTPSTGSWQYVACKVDGTNITVYLDDQKESTTQTVTPAGNAHDYAIGQYGEIGTHYFDGKIDEVRLRSGDKNDAWFKANYYNFTDQLITFGTEEEAPGEIDESETVNIGEGLELQESKEFDDGTIQIGGEVIETSEAEKLSIDDGGVDIGEGDLEVQEDLGKSEGVTIGELSEISQSLEKIDESEGVTIGESAEIANTEIFSSGVKIISYNPLVTISDTDPVTVAKINITDPANPTWTIYKINALGETVRNAKDIVFNDVFDLLYIACANGKILKININDFNDREEIDTGDSNDLLNISSLDGYHSIYAGTDDTTGELLMIDNSEIATLNTDLRIIASKTETLKTHLAFINAGLLNTDLRILAESRHLLTTDLRILKFDYQELPANAINQTAWEVYIDDVLVTDIDSDNITIVHTVDEQSQATFNLIRRHDKFNNKIDGTASQISNNNTVKIKINGIEEFSGKVYEISGDSESALVNVVAYADEKTDDRKTVLLPLTILNSSMHPYDIVMEQPVIDNPEIDPYDTDPEYYKGIRINLGEKITQSVTRQRAFDSASSYPTGLGQPVFGNNAYEIMEGDFEYDPNWTYFWGPIQAENYLSGQSFDVFYSGTSLNGFSSDTWEIVWASYRRQREFDDIIIKLGDGQVTVNDLENIVDNATEAYNILGSKGFIDGTGNIQTKFKETFSAIEMELGLPASDTEEIYNLLDTHLGYTVGEAPYDDISETNGQFFTKFKWVDKTDGLYSEKEEGYDYVEYIKKIADLAYQKLQNINGEVLPKTSASISLMLDGYYYYGISLLTRINVTNTTEAGIYTNNNGFPVSVKSIEINSGSMLVTLTCDNSWSQKELEEIDDQYPAEDDDEYILPASSVKIHPKFDPQGFKGSYWEIE